MELRQGPIRSGTWRWNALPFQPRGPRRAPHTVFPTAPASGLVVMREVWAMLGKPCVGRVVCPYMKGPRHLGRRRESPTHKTTPKTKN